MSLLKIQGFNPKFYAVEQVRTTAFFDSVPESPWIQRISRVKKSAAVHALAAALAHNTITWIYALRRKLLIPSSG
jgi:hypothetical protein